jgi:SPP1 family predicted phage head-tail adaptor
MKCCEMNAGKLRNKIEIQRRDKTPDGAGGFKVDWVKIADTWAWIKPMGGTEGLVAMQLQAQVSHDIIIRYRSNLTAADRIVFQGRAFNIVSVIDIEERQHWMQLRCMEGVAQ